MAVYTIIPTIVNIHLITTRIIRGVCKDVLLGPPNINIWHVHPLLYIPADMECALHALSSTATVVVALGCLEDHNSAC